jgi:hypothetical protein
MPAFTGHTTVREPLDSHGSRCSAADELRRTAWPGPRAPPVTGWLQVLAEQCSPFGPVPLQNLQPYYGPLRPCAPHRYSGPRSFSRLDFSLHIGTAGSHVPYKSLIRLRAAYMPDARSGSLQDYSRTRPGSSTRPRFRHHPWHFDTSSAVRFRSPLRTIPDGIKSRLLLQRSPPSLLTRAACSGLTPAPDRRRRGAHPHLSYSATPSFSEDVFVTHRRDASDRSVEDGTVAGAERLPVRI